MRITKGEFICGMVIAFVMLFGVPLYAGPADSLGGVLSFFGDLLKSPITWSAAGVMSAILAYFIRDWKPEDWRRTGNSHGFLLGRWVSIKLTAIPAFGWLWQTVVEKWLVKILAFISAYVASFFVGIVSGLASDNVKAGDESDGKDR